MSKFIEMREIFEITAKPCGKPANAHSIWMSSQGRVQGYVTRQSLVGEVFISSSMNAKYYSYYLLASCSCFSRFVMMYQRVCRIFHLWRIPLSDINNQIFSNTQGTTSDNCVTAHAYVRRSGLFTPVRKEKICCSFPLLLTALFTNFWSQVSWYGGRTLWESLVCSGY